MNDLAKKWVNALRSGSYRKTTEVLSKRGDYCVLGVACDVAIKAGIPLNVEKIYDEEHKTKVTFYDGEDTVLPQIVQKALGLKTPSGYSGRTDLITINDKSGMSFKEIADLIEFAEPLLFNEETI